VWSERPLRSIRLNGSEEILDSLESDRQLSFHVCMFPLLFFFLVFSSLLAQSMYTCPLNGQILYLSFLADFTDTDIVQKIGGDVLSPMA
jgi:hypothetical protein